MAFKGFLGASLTIINYNSPQKKIDTTSNDHYTGVSVMGIGGAKKTKKRGYENPVFLYGAEGGTQIQALHN
jgi:hypothetical protein